MKLTGRQLHRVGAGENSYRGTALQRWGATLDVSAPRTVSVIVYSSQGVVQDTLDLREIPPGGGITITRNGMLTGTLPIPFAPAPIVAVDPDGNVVYSDGVQYESNVTRASESMARRFARDRRLDVVTKEVDSVVVLPLIKPR